MNYKKEFNDIQKKEMECIFKKWEKNNLVIIYGKREDNVVDTYGLPYTSTGFAGLWNTNVDARLKNNSKWKFDGLALTEKGKVVAIFTNDAEKEYFEIIGTITM